MPDGSACVARAPLPSPKQHAAMSSAGSGETSTLTELHDHILSSPPLLSRGATAEVGWQLVNAGAVMEAGTCLMSATTWPVLALAPVPLQRL